MNWLVSFEFDAYFKGLNLLFLDRKLCFIFKYLYVTYYYIFKESLWYCVPTSRRSIGKPRNKIMSTTTKIRRSGFSEDITGLKSF